MQHKGYSTGRAVELILRSLLGNLSKEDETEYNQLKQSTGLAKHINWLNAPHELPAKLEEGSWTDTEKAYRTFWQRTTAHSSRHITMRRLKIAASFMLPLTIGIIAYYIQSGNPTIHDNPTAQIATVGHKASIVLANGSVIKLSNQSGAISNTNEGTITTDSGQIIYSATTSFQSELIYNELIVPRSGEYMLKLTDGTKIWLNSDSRLRFPIQFHGKTREVYLSGEAYFTVKHDTTKPFIVHTSLGSINVLGTEFNVRDYSDESQVVTTLVNGKVRYQDKNVPERYIILNPSFQVMDCATQKKLTAKQVNIQEFTGWKDGLYIFNGLTLEQIMKTVERNYDVTVFYTNENIKHLRFSGDLKKYSNVEQFLRFIETGGDVCFTIRDRTITVNPK